MSFFNQVAAVTAMNVSTLPQRLGASLVTIVGVATTVLVMISLLSVAAGLSKTATKTASPDRAVVTPAGQPGATGAIPRSAIPIIADAPGVRRSAEGKPLVQPSATVVVEVVRRRDGATSNIRFAGVGDVGPEMSDTLTISQGRRFRTGVHELIAGRAASEQYENLGLGDRIRLRGSEWTVVGVYEDDGGIAENSIAAEVDTVLAAFERPSYTSVNVRLTSAEAFDQFKDALTTNPQLNVEVKRQTEAAREQARGLTGILNFVGYVVGVVMAVGAVFGALNTMYAAVDGRRREVATLRALGFSGRAVLLSVLLESLVLSVPAALLGAALAWAIFNGNAVNTLGLTFQLAVTPPLVVAGIAFSILIGLVGGLFPGVRASSSPIATALRNI